MAASLALRLRRLMASASSPLFVLQQNCHLPLLPSNLPHQSQLQCFSSSSSSSNSNNDVNSYSKNGGTLRMLSSSSSSSPLLLRRPPYSIHVQSFSTNRTPIGEDGKIGPDTILFEGCDYNHWLITMDFPKDPKPTPEEMVETYVQTLAKVVGSVEEAKTRMYACSTTTYTGFQAVMTEEMSEKFRGLPGVVFILPDSYIDPVNKEYGGDKYINGTIIPRPPPVHYGRQGRPYNDRNRNPMPMQHQESPDFQRRGPPQYGQQSSMPGGQQNYPPPGNYAPPSQVNSGGYYPPGSRDNYQPGQRGFGGGEIRDRSQQFGRDHRAGEQINPRFADDRHYAAAGGYPQGERSTVPTYEGNNSHYGQGSYASGGGYPQGERPALPSYEGNISHPGQESYASGGGYPQGERPTLRSYERNNPHPGQVSYGSGYRDHIPPTSDGSYRSPVTSHTGAGEGREFTNVEGSGRKG